MTREELLTLRVQIKRILKLDSHTPAIKVLATLKDHEQYLKIDDFLTNIEQTSPILINRRDIFRLGEIVGTVETLLTIEEKQK